jgi:hypothetical protein
MFPLLRIVYPVLIVTRSREVRRVYSAARDMATMLRNSLGVFLFFLFLFAQLQLRLFEDEESTAFTTGLKLFRLVNSDGLTEALSHSVSYALFVLTFVRNVLFYYYFIIIFLR